MSQLTANFTSEEMQCKCGNCDGGSMDKYFMQKLQRIRDAYDKPMKVNSGCRCEAYNKTSGGSLLSMHLQGRAADIECIEGASKFKLMMIAIGAGMNGIGIGKEFLHFDDREHQTLWTY